MIRRSFLRAAAAGAAVGVLPACGHGDAVPHSPVNFVAGKPLPWINWSGNQSCTPALRLAPASEAELVDALKGASGVVRAVGASHSFSAVVPTDGTLIATDLLSGLVGHDAASLRAEIWAGTRMHALGPLLHGVGQAVPNMPDMDYPAMGGAIVNSVHGTGQRYGSMSSCVTALTLATPSGQLIDCSATSNSEIFHAARTSVGALGIVSRMTLQNEKPFRLVETTRIEKTEDVLAELAKRCAAHRNFEFLPLPHSTLAVTVATDLAGPNDTPSGEDDPEAVNSLRTLLQAVSWIPGMGEAAYDKLLATFLAGGAAQVRVGHSFDVFPHVRVVRFREMEYTVPAESGPDCVREILRTIRQRKLPIAFPLEYRYVKADDIWLSMFEGRDGCSISVHQYGDTDHRAYFAEIEPIFWKYQGRPHWGKLHTLDAARLAALYPRHWKDFQQLRRSLDPQGRMMNAHLKHIFGV
ncbi:D-arabinono-1,4-lactone oxidase [Rugamonas sp. CCM 8940]|uniref:D-arabinono-1,4-lactone oxidase n=1 Tax=Rugamonas sp. CCM 8940 TaxID=2765359 RepID=UPI0018F2C879|nr:D-arabinono-1,4-lactone oxidase [Rugamonas sp. CCM 8940]MBJ7313640.1 FAD-binding protein [Rugamonas sp. CCM 8940]